MAKIIFFHDDKATTNVISKMLQQEGHDVTVLASYDTTEFDPKNIEQADLAIIQSTFGDIIGSKDGAKIALDAVHKANVSLRVGITSDLYPEDKKTTDELRADFYGSDYANMDWYNELLRQGPLTPTEIKLRDNNRYYQGMESISPPFQFSPEIE